MTTISVKDKCTYMRCEMAGKARHLADSFSKRISHGTKKLISHCTCFMNVRTEGSVEYVLGHLGHEKTPMKIRHTTIEIEAILLLLKEKHSPNWISQYFKENTSGSDKLHAISSADLRSVMYSYLNSEEQEEILGLDREEANLNWTTASPCNSATPLETVSRMEPLPAKESASENEHDIMEITTSANLSAPVLPNNHLEPAKHSNSLLVEDTRLVSDFIGFSSGN
ncbi:unnamed protein product [Onchocerca flexuosa]|nr:unnamed protein product [Onchocerca flexuosa]